MEMTSVNKSQLITCPKCHVGLEVALSDKVPVRACVNCHGIWVAHAEDRDILQIQPQAFTVDELRRLRVLYEPLQRTDPVKYYPCPECKNMMNRRNWGSHSGVIVDKCRDHGIWYDAGEPEKIRDYIAKGGIEWEKLQISEQGISDLDRKLTNKIAEVDRRIDSAYMRARLWSFIL